MDATPTPKKPRKTRRIRTDLDSKPGKYFLARKAGKRPMEAMAVAGYDENYRPHRIEKTEQFQAIEKKYYKDVLLEKVSLNQIAEEQSKVILQDRDLGAKNTAIKNALDRIEPDVASGEDEERVLVILKG